MSPTEPAAPAGFSRRYCLLRVGWRVHGTQGTGVLPLQECSTSRGFTLLEVVLALVLLVGGIAASTYLFGRGMYAAVDSESITQAAALAQEKLEQLRGNSFASVVSEAKAVVSGWTGFSREVTVSQPTGTNGDFKQVGVTVYWNSNEGEISVSLATFVADIDNA